MALVGLTCSSSGFELDFSSLVNGIQDNFFFFFWEYAKCANHFNTIWMFIFKNFENMQTVLIA